MLIIGGEADRVRYPDCWLKEYPNYKAIWDFGCWPDGAGGGEVEEEQLQGKQTVPIPASKTVVVLLSFIKNRTRWHWRWLMNK